MSEKSTRFNQKYNYHTHTYRSGHSEYTTDEELVLAAQKANITTLGFSEHIPNPDIVLPEEHNRMLLSEVDEYLKSIQELKEKYPSMQILSSFEAEYIPGIEPYLIEMRGKVDYLILGQHFIKDHILDSIHSVKDVNYPIEYAKIICKALDTGLFDIVAHPDHFMQNRRHFSDKESVNQFMENAKIASKMIVDKAKEMGVPIEMNMGQTPKNKRLEDGFLLYPHPLFWKIAKEIEKLKVIIGIDAHNPGYFNHLEENFEKIENVEKIVREKESIKPYNPITAREKNIKLQEAYAETLKKASTLETELTNILLSNVDLQDKNSLLKIQATLQTRKEEKKSSAEQKLKEAEEEYNEIIHSNETNTEEQKLKLSRKKLAIQETAQAIKNQQNYLNRLQKHIEKLIPKEEENKIEIAPVESTVIKPQEPSVVENTEPTVIEPQEPLVIENTEPTVIEPQEPLVVEKTEPLQKKKNLPKEANTGMVSNIILDVLIAITAILIMGMLVLLLNLK